MKRISSEKIVSELKQIIFRFPLTVVFILLLTAWQIYTKESVGTFEPTFLLLIIGIIFSATSQLFYERFFKQRVQMRWILYGLVIIFVLLYRFYLSSSHSLIDDSWNFYSIPGIRTMILYFVAVILFIWAPTIKSKIKFSDSFLVTFKTYFITSFFSIILFLGVIFTFSLFEFLFFTIKMDWFFYSSVFIFCLFAPILFLTFIPDYFSIEPESINEERTVEQSVHMPKFLHHLISYILIPVMAILTGIIVVYILINLRGKFFTENILEGLLLSYAINGWILLILADSIENKMALWFKKIFPIALIFVLIFQMISTFLQIREVGVTHGRYIILMFGVGSVISGVWYIFKKNHLQLLPIVAIIAGLISLTPPIDALTISVNQQRGRINDVLNKYDMLIDSNHVTPNPDVSINDQETIQESLNYLSEIRALNQLEWLPEKYYYREDEYLGFVTEHNSWGQDGNYREEINQANVSLDEEHPNIPISEFEQIFDLSLGDNFDDFSESVDLKGEAHVINVQLDEEFIIEMDADRLEEPLEFDFSYVLEDFKGRGSLSLPREKLTFTEEIDDYQVQIIIRYLNISGNYMQMDFYLLL
ncbi:protein of unknown function [Atopostipes suicloacalis DSM 15692]|uniref:DUF4153 domain-containing protein n=1 Tax=Atopostipes suicloacalis DSM 15692 TaxID=1121025 RepID=A0A1M4SI71_9LACT|nr:DUF4153 domain-containing protein [Atopostipes suicloacalis]SHE31905.1 protein of unknown function [Atopostipes suicloacalis DSM 15692]